MRPLVSRLSAWDWWMQDLPELLLPAQGLGVCHPLAARALSWEELRTLERLAQRRPASRLGPVRARLGRLLGRAGAARELEQALGADKGLAEARLWRAESLLRADPRRALSLLNGLQGTAAWLYRGAACCFLGRYPRAAWAFASAARDLPREAAPPWTFLPRFLEGLAWERAGEAQKALESLADAESRGCRFAALRWLRAFALQALGRERELGAEVEEAMQLFSEPGFDALLGGALRRESLSGGEPSPRTLRLLDRAVSGPHPAWALVARAEVLRSPRFCRYEAAARDLARAARLSPASPWAWAYLGRGLDSIGQGQRALRSLNRAAAQAPDSGWIRAWRGAALLRRRNRRALGELDRAAVLAPDYPFARAWRGGALHQAGRLAEAARELETAVRLEPGYEWSFAQLFEVRRRQGRWCEAARLLTEAYEREMKFTWARREDPESCRRALAELERARVRGPRAALPAAWRAWVRLGLGQWQEAERDIRPFLAAGEAFVHFVSGELEQARGRLREAVSCYGRAAALRPAAAYLGARGVALYHLGRLREAVLDLARAVQLNGTSARFLCALGAARLEQGRTALARECLDRALGLNPDYSEALAHRAEAWRRCGRRPLAKRDLQRARELRPDCPWAALVASRLARGRVEVLSELLKVAERGAELPERVARAARRRMRLLATLALKRFKAGLALGMLGLFLTVGARSGEPEPLLGAWTGHRRWVYAVAFLPDGRSALSTGSDSSLRRWEVPSGRPLGAWAPRGGPWSALAVSPDRGKVLLGGEDGFIHVLDPRSGQERAAWPGHAAEVTSLSVSRDGRLAFSGGADAEPALRPGQELQVYYQSLKLWDMSTGRVISSWSGHPESVTGVALSPEAGRGVSCGFDRTLKIWDLPSARLVAVSTGHPTRVQAVAYSPDGRRVLSAGEDGTVRLWDADTGRALEVWRGHTDTVWAVAYSSDGLRALSGSEDGTLRLWEARSGRELAVLRGHVGAVRAVAFSPDGRLALSGGRDKRVRLWRLLY